MTTAYLIPTFGAGFQAFTSQGVVAAGAKLYTYVAGSVNSPLPSYTDSTAAVPNANPLILGSDGRPTTEIWITAAAVKIVLQDANSNPLGTWDFVPAILGI